jgi:hypothetical protein
MARPGERGSYYLNFWSGANDSPGRSPEMMSLTLFDSTATSRMSPIPTRQSGPEAWNAMPSLTTPPFLDTQPRIAPISDFGKQLPSLALTSTHLMPETTRLVSTPLVKSAISLKSCTPTTTCTRVNCFDFSNSISGLLLVCRIS